MAKGRGWTQELIDEYSLKFDELGELEEKVEEEAKKSLSNEIVERLRQVRSEKDLAWSSLKKPLTRIRSALNPKGFSGTFTSEEWDLISSETEAQNRRNFREAIANNEVKEAIVGESGETLVQNPPIRDEMSFDLNQVLDEQEIDLVKEACEKSGLSLSELIKRGIMAEAKTQISRADNTVSFDGMTIEEVAASTSKEASQELARKAIDAIMAHNDNATEKPQKWFISQGFVSSFLKKRLSVNVHQATVKKVIEAQRIRIEDHNQKHGLQPLDNRKGTNSPWSISDIALAF